MFSTVVSFISQKVGDLVDLVESELSLSKLVILFIVMSFSCKVNTDRFSVSYEPIVGKAILALAAFAPGNSGIKFTFWNQEIHKYEDKQESCDNA